MAREYFCCYHSYLDVMEQLNDTERGRLFTACLQYSKTGEAPELRGNERFVFPAFRSQIDRDNANYEQMCQKQSANSKKRWDAKRCDGMPPDATGCHRMPDDANDANAKTKEKANTKEILNPPLPPLRVEADAQGPDLSCLSSALQEKLRQWLAYKQERRESYKPVGLQALVTKIKSSAEKYGDGAVCDLIDLSMSSGYQGILFDRLQKQTWKGQKEIHTSQNHQPSDWSKDAVRRMMERAGEDGGT